MRWLAQFIDEHEPRTVCHCCWCCNASWKGKRYSWLKRWEFPSVYVVPVNVRNSRRSLMHRRGLMT